MAANAKPPARKRATAAGATRTLPAEPDGQAEDPALEELLRVLTEARDGNFSVRLRARRRDVMGEVQQRTNELIALNARMAKELARVSRIIGR
ncbi:MAG: hypothetical protein QOJ85_4720, partial [Solirubrobacteraceae bacterium]|nr:hypothetical protein [Solirubrobacteraceae bacterium]